MQLFEVSDLFYKYENGYAYGWVFFGSIQLHHEAPGVISEDAGWCVFQSCYMYGPCDTWYEAIWIFLSEYKNDKHLVG